MTKQTEIGVPQMKQNSFAVPLLLMLALAVDLLTPFLIWKGIIPAQTRWISHAVIAAMIPLTYVRMMLANGVPRPVYFALFLLVIETSVALLRGQSLLATTWGCWVMFQFPLVGLFSYLWPYWSNRFADRLWSFSLVVLVLQVLVQIAQYLTGQAAGDNLAGLFGEFGTGRLVLFLLFVYCLGLGRWLVSGEWRTVVLIMLLGGVSSALGEMKMFPLAIIALTITALVVSAIQHANLVKIMSFAAASTIALLGCVVAYEKVVVEGGFSSTSITAYLDKDTRDRYMSGAYGSEGSAAYMGRNYAFAHGWETIRQDGSTLLFGFGLGARSESHSLGATGAGLQEERGDFKTGTGLLVLLHEMGVIGLLFVAISMAWIVVTIVREIRSDRASKSLQLRYAILFFTLLWPLWFWYAHVLTFRVVMLFYWASLGYVLGESGLAAKRLAARSKPMV